MRFALLSFSLLLASVVCAHAGEAVRSAGQAPPRALANGSFKAELNGFRIHYEVHGSGPVLMTVPNSWGLSFQGLRAMYRPLEEKLTVVYFDPRGMGASGPVREESDRGLAAVRADFQELRRHLGLEKVHAIGWSNGAVNLIWLAHEHPETLASAIFVHGMASSTAEDTKQLEESHPELMRIYRAFMEEIRAPGLSPAEKTARQRRMWLDDYFPILVADPAKSGTIVREVFKDAELSWAHAEYANKEMPTFDARDKLSAIGVRSLVIAGAHDLVRPQRVKVLQDGLRDSKFVVFEKSGHFAPMEEPELFKAAIYGFLAVSGGPAKAASRGTPP
jgi:proline iminopeptidase